MSNGTKFLLTLGAALAVGAVLGVLYAPEEGDATRKKLMKKSRRLAGTASAYIDDGMESLEDIKDSLQKQISKVNRKLAELKH